MLALLTLSCLVTFCIYYVPAFLLHVLALDEHDPNQFGLAIVASHNPFRESGPPANMAKLILLRQKIQTSNRKRRSSSRTRQPRPFVMNSSRQPRLWARLRRPWVGKQYH